MNLRGKTALITGGARRVGKALTQALAHAGASVAINYNESGDDARELCGALEQTGVTARAYQADVSDVSAIGKLVADVAADFGRIDVLVNNASVFKSKPLLQITEAEWDHVQAVNLKGPFFLAQAVAPLMKQNGSGCIVNIADLSAFQPWPSYAHHSVSKAGLVHLTKILARALAPEIRVNAIAPGTVLPPEDYDGTAGDGTSDRRVVTPKGTPEDVIKALFYLLESNFVTGQVVIVDGGRMLL